jgi:hypothetical protein
MPSGARISPRFSISAENVCPARWAQHGPVDGVAILTERHAHEVGLAARGRPLTFEAGAWPQQIAASGHQRERQGRGGGGWVSGVGAEPDLRKHHVSPPQGQHDQYLDT